MANEPGGRVADAATAVIDEPTFEVEVPSGLVLDAGVVSHPADLPTTEDGAQPDDETVERTPAPARAAPAAPAQPSEPVAAEPPAPAREPEEPDPAMRRRAVEAADDLARVDADIEAGRRARLSVPAADADEMSDQEWDALIADARGAAAQAEDYGQAIETAFSKLRAVDKQRATKRAERQRTREYNAKLSALEQAAGERYHDFQEVMDQSEMWNHAMGQTGANPVLQRLIYSAVDPADKAYWLGRAALSKKLGKSIDAPDLVKATAPAAAPPVTAAPAPVAVAPRDAAAVRREATRETVEAVRVASERPTGLRDIPPAGPARRPLSVVDLDRMAETNPDAYYKLVQANPGLDYFHMSGGDTPA